MIHSAQGKGGDSSQVCVTLKWEVKIQREGEVNTQVCVVTSNAPLHICASASSVGRPPEALVVVTVSKR